MYFKLEYTGVNNGLVSQKVDIFPLNPLFVPTCCVEPLIDQNITNTI